MTCRKRRILNGQLCLRSVLVVAVSAIGGCSNGVVEATKTTGIVTGVVSVLSGTLPEVSVRATAYAPSCSSGKAVGSGIGVASPPDGRYTLNIVSPDPPQGVCVVVMAIRTLNAQQDTALGGPAALNLRNDFDANQDTAHINLVFP